MVTAQAKAFAVENSAKKGMHVGRTPHMHTFFAEFSWAVQTEFCFIEQLVIGLIDVNCSPTIVTKGWTTQAPGGRDRKSTRLNSSH